MRGRWAACMRRLLAGAEGLKKGSFGWKACLGMLTLLLAAAWTGHHRGGGQSEGREPGGLSGTVRMAGSTSMEEMVWALAEAFMEKYPDVTVTAEFVGSSAGAEAVIQGSADIGNLSRGVSPEEEAMGLVENRVAVSGIAVCVDASNPVAELTRGQLEDIYRGRIVSWREMGGEDLPVVTVGREAGSGTREAFEDALGMRGQCVYANELDSTGAVMARVSNTPGAIGYISLDAANDTVRILKLADSGHEGAGETERPAEGARQEGYVLACPYIMATKGKISDQSALVQAWFAFVRSREGQDIMKRILGPADE